MTTDLQILNNEQMKRITRRLTPRHGDFEYLVNVDLRLAIEPISTSEKLTILDYGADLFPYKPLFPNSDYRCADFAGYGAIDYILNADGTVPEKDNVFDLIISTQVAEHVESPPSYLSECFRLLKPGGRLFITTHGSYEDHAYPYDFQRWTADGLKRDLEKANFVVDYINKLTAGPRAAVYQLERCLASSFMSRKTIPGMSFWLGRLLLKYTGKYIHKLSDRWFKEYQSVPGDDWNYRIYICLAALASCPNK